MKPGEKKEVDSFTDPTKGYYVFMTSSGLKCTCPDFVYSKGKHYKCKHIEKIENDEKGKGK